VRNKTILAVVLCCTLAGCTAAGVWSQIQKWEPTALQAFSYILSILQAGGVIGPNPALASDAAMANADFGDLGTVIADIKLAPNDATVLGRAVAVLGVLQAHLSQIEADAHLTNTSDQEAVKLGLEGLITTLTAFRAELTPVAAGRAKLSSVKVPDVRVFKIQWNTIMVTHGHADKQL
jgi:hypothetical protein